MKIITAIRVLKPLQIGAAVFALSGVLMGTQATATTLTLTESSEFLIIGTGPSSAAIAAKQSNYELGANQAPVPSPSSYGPSLDGNVPDLPAGIQAIPTGVLGNGEIAVTNSSGQFDFSNVGLYAAIGVQCADSASDCAKSVSNSAFNQPGYPNDSAGTDNPFNPTFQLAAGNGVTGGVDFTAFDAELSAAAVAITNFAATAVINFGAGALTSDLVTTLVSGFNIIDLVATGDIDIKANWVIDGPSDAFGIFRVPDGKNFKITQGNILAGSGLGGLDQLIIASLNDSNGEHFNFNQTVINGVAFWSLFGGDFGEININDAQGCTQLIGAKVNLNNVRLSRCAPTTFSDDPGETLPPVPIPAALPLFLAALAGLGFLGRAARRKTAA